MQILETKTHYFETSFEIKDTWEYEAEENAQVGPEVDE